MEWCRACLSTEDDLMPMGSDFVNNFNLLTNLNVKLSNAMPIYTCNTCYEAVNFCAEFREKCIASDKTLMEVLHRNSSPKCEDKNELVIDIKEEINNLDESNCILEQCYEEPLIGTDDSSLLKTEGNVSVDGNDDWSYFKTDEKDWSTSKTYKLINKKIKKKTKERDKLVKLVVKIEDTLIPCGICSKSFKNEESLVKHFEYHRLHKSCGLCTEQFLDFTHLLSHRISHLPEKYKKCHICLKRFVVPEYLEFHYMKVHNFRGKDGQLLCKQCLSPYETPRKLKKHALTSHAAIKYTCNDCGKGFRVKQPLITHMLVHVDKKTYECDLCSFTSKCAIGIREHKVRRHTKERVYCKTCGRAFSSLSVLEKHNCKKNLNGICSVCGIHVKSSLLERHVRTHSNKHRYQCDRCPAKFKTKSSYKAHKNKHDGNRPFHCDHCPMSFYSHPVLIKHRRTHTGEKPYVCHICEKGFTSNYNRKVHMKVHGQNLIVKKIDEEKFHKF